MTVETNHLKHSTWGCKYHVVFTPKYRREYLFGFLRRELKDVLHRAREAKGARDRGGLLA